jgi:hypothetical protein
MLTAYQIAESFPEESKEFIPKILPVLRSKNLSVYEKCREIEAMVLSPEEKELCKIFANSFASTEITETIKLYEKVMDLVNRDFSNDLAFQKRVEMAKAVPIEGMYQFQKSRITANRIHASCPFHGKDDHPSLVVYKETNSFHCFTCKASGDAIDFFMMINKVRFTDAVKGLNKW